MFDHIDFLLQRGVFRVRSCLFFSCRFFGLTGALTHEKSKRLADQIEEFGKRHV